MVNGDHHSSLGLPVGDHVGHRRNEVNGESDKQSTDGGVDGSEKWEDDGEEPDWYDDG